jgi:hypothetical protein
MFSRLRVQGLAVACRGVYSCAFTPNALKEMCYRMHLRPREFDPVVVKKFVGSAQFLSFDQFARSNEFSHPKHT